MQTNLIGRTVFFSRAQPNSGAGKARDEFIESLPGVTLESSFTIHAVYYTGDRTTVVLSHDKDGELATAPLAIFRLDTN